MAPETLDLLLKDHHLQPLPRLLPRPRHLLHFLWV